MSRNKTTIEVSVSISVSTGMGTLLWFMYGSSMDGMRTVDEHVIMCDGRVSVTRMLRSDEGRGLLFDNGRFSIMRKMYPARIEKGGA